MTSVVAFVLLLLVSLVLLCVLLAALYVVVSAAVEQGVRRSLPDSALRPSVRERLRREDEW